MPDGRHATAGPCSLGVLPLGTAPGVSKTCGDGCGPQPARSDTDRALRPSQPGCILYVVVHKFILNAATGGCPGGRSGGWGGPGHSRPDRPTSTGLLVEAGGWGRPGSGLVLARGRALRSTACLCDAAPVVPPRLTALPVPKRRQAAANLDLNDRSCHRPRPGVPALL